MGSSVGSEWHSHGGLFHNPYQVGPLLVINGVISSINGLVHGYLGLFHPYKRSYGPQIITGRGPPCKNQRAYTQL